VLVRVERKGEHCAWVVEDGGPGLPPEVLLRVGEPFTTTRATGTGMGLAVVRRVMQASQGQIEIGSSSLGGTGVWLWVPASAE
jgi:signal transduction histidine kinase